MTTKDLNLTIKKALKFEVQVGVVKKKEKVPYPSKFKSFLGGKARVATKKPSGKTTVELAKKFEKTKKIFSAPRGQIADIKSALESVVLARLSGGRVANRSFENLFSASVKNPIVEKRYGKNSKVTKLIKGFDWKMVDTGQFIESIDSRIVDKK